MCGVGTGPPNVEHIPKPTSSSKISKTFGLPCGASSGRGKLAVESLYVVPIVPVNTGSGLGNCAPPGPSAARGDPATTAMTPPSEPRNTARATVAERVRDMRGLRGVERDARKGPWTWAEALYRHPRDRSMIRTSGFEVLDAARTRLGLTGSGCRSRAAWWAPLGGGSGGSLDSSLRAGRNPEKTARRRNRRALAAAAPDRARPSPIASA